MTDRRTIRRHADHEHTHEHARPVPVVAPAAVAAVEALVTAPPVPRAGLVHPIQHKLVVGGADDPAEAEAERVAASVVTRLRRTPASAAPVTGGCGHLGHGDGCAPAAAPVRRHADGPAHGSGLGHGAGPGTGHADHDAPIGFAGGDVDARTEALLAAPAGGSAIPGAVRGDLESALGADLSGIRLHAGSTATVLNRSMSALAFTHGRDVYFRDGLPDTSSDAGLHLLAHELTHTVQQGTAPVVARTHVGDIAGSDPTATIGVQRRADRTIHRHAAFEHYLLGQLQPKDLASIPEVRAVKDNAGQLANAQKPGGSRGLDSTTKRDDAARANVEHILNQEMERLLKYRDNPDLLDMQAGKMGEVKAEDGVYQVPIVVLTCKDGERLVVSYSEMNTMPDLFGNPEAISVTPKKQVLALLQGVRQQLYIELSKIRKEIFGEANNELRHVGGREDDFKNAQGPRSQAVNESLYEKRTEMQVNSATKKNGVASEEYFAALERNACHFAPESWAQWRGYHDRAMSKAADAAAGKIAATHQADPNKAGIDRDGARVAANEAMVLNSFGEHYLQDSFAAGHLIDKTKIMQWFTVWIAEKAPAPAKGQDKGMGTTAKAGAAWKMSVHAAKSDLQSNPQALHDKSVRGELAGPAAAATAVGLAPTPEIIFMMKWRSAAKSDKKFKTLTRDTASRLGNSNGFNAEAWLTALVDKGFATTTAGKQKMATRFRGSSGTSQTWTLDQEMIDVIDAGKAKGGSVGTKLRSKNAYAAQQGTVGGAIDDATATAAAGEFNLAAYNAMISNAYIGGSTKYFHDRFCKEGLEVKSGEGVVLGRIYGDSNMMNAGGAKGLEYAAETSKMSREAVFDVINGKAEKHSTDQIANRFPKFVNVDDKWLSVAQWNEQLKAQGEAGLFKEAQSAGARLVYKIKDGISSEGALDVKAMAGHGAF